MRKRENGFSLVELIMALGITMLVLAAAITFFAVSVNQYKTQTKIIASNIEGVIGLELLRRDIENMGFGLPWNNLPAYPERTGVSADLLLLNDSGNAPRAIIGIADAAFTTNNSDFFGIKSIKAGIRPAAGKWTLLNYSGDKRIWSPASENLENTDYVIVLSIGSADANRRWLVNPGSFYTLYSNTAAYVPDDLYATNVVYGIGDEVPVRPFNRADYFIDNTSSALQCAPETGTLVKGIVNHNTTGSLTLLPLLDCVADMKVVYGLDDDADRQVDTWWPVLPNTMTAADIRARLVEVRVSILAHEGKKDDSFQYPEEKIFVGSEGIGRFVDVGTRKNYRWKVYNLAVKPLGLAQ